MITTETLDFLRELKLNNDRGWFEIHKKEYQHAYGEFLDTVVKLILAIGEFDKDVAGSHLDPKSCIMRINRDVRFSKDKSPYKTNFFAFINRGGRKSPYGGYYFHIEPGESFIGGGIYMPEPAVLDQLRGEIDRHFSEWHSIISKKEFISRFPKGVEPSGSLKRPPKGYEVTNPAMEYLKFKGYYTQQFLSDREVTDSALISRISDTFLSSKPMIDFLNRAL
ncbi:DUF2461 domain-containing protein [Chlorobium sp. BLA1]|uniref:DUF2461 domain-containing protein n=1 Tax=Candidatus Chlorobium masyuteum TaxID=2716876 RepID=UPI0014240A83|nr:DUF2461 domain-containing protein [Candidatus Chlorobium masyuteum]NHQ60275.1 DUF2461 domain-containing protein [Candidatus Chlorobium masyuteum]